MLFLFICKKQKGKPDFHVYSHHTTQNSLALLSLCFALHDLTLCCVAYECVKKSSPFRSSSSSPSLAKQTETKLLASGCEEMYLLLQMISYVNIENHIYSVHETHLDLDIYYALFFRKHDDMERRRHPRRHHNHQESDGH